MTVCIAVNFEDGTFLMADGRLSRPYSGSSIIDDNAIKLHVVADKIVCAEYGLEFPTQVALNHIRPEILNQAETAKDVLQEFERACIPALTELVRNFQPTRDQLPKYRFGFFFGGLLFNQTSFIGGYLWNPEDQPSTFIETTSGRFSAVGGNDDITKSLFNEKLSECLENEYPVSNPVLNPFVQACIDAGVFTIREVQKTHPDVGGRIHYYVIRRSYEIHYGEVT